MARYLEMIGHRVFRISTTDARESYVLLEARRQDIPPERVATVFHDLAAATLRDLDMPQDSLFNTHAPDRAPRYVRRSHEIARFLRARNRVQFSRVRYPRGAATGQFLVGGFVLGNCPRCNGGVAGACCEDCGLWFGVDKLQNAHPRLADDGPMEWAEAGAATLDATDVFTIDNIATRFPAEYHVLYEDYVRWNGPALPLTHPLGWGVPWQGDDLGSAVVHHSYAIGAHASMNAIADEFDRISGRGDPFSRENSAIKITTGGYDAVLPWMFHVAMMDKASDWEPFDHHLITRYMLLEGEKFSTSRGHAIWAHDYVRSGLSVNALRMYLATISPTASDSDFRLSEFEAYGQNVLGALIERRTAEAAGWLRGRPEELSPAGASIVQSVLADFARSLDPRTFNLALAARIVHDWCVQRGNALFTAEPYWWCKVMAATAYPIMPIWGCCLWHRLGHDGQPSFVEFGQLPPGLPDGRIDLPPLLVDSAKLAVLARPGDPVDAR